MGVHRICPKCHRDYILGVNGIASGCDICMGVKRDKKGYAWEPGENVKHVEHSTEDRIVTVKRPAGL